MSPGNAAGRSNNRVLIADSRDKIHMHGRSVWRDMLVFRLRLVTAGAQLATLQPLPKATEAELYI